MKNTTPKFFGLIAALLALAAPVFGAQIGDDSLTIGKKGSSANKTVKMGNGRVVWNQTSGKLTFSNDGGGSFKNFGSGGGGGSGINLLTDFNFDFEGGTANWTKSTDGSTFTTATSGSNLIFDVQSGVFNSSASGQSLSSQTISIPEGFKNGNGAAGCFFKTAASDYKFQVFDGTNVLAERVIPVISGAAQKIAISFVFPASGSVKLRILSQSDASDLAVDNCFLGENSLIQISQANYFGGISMTGASCTWNAAQAGYADFSAASTCSYTLKGNATSPATQLPSIKFSTMPAGEYYFAVRTSGACTAVSPADTAQCALRLYDGTTNLGEQIVGQSGLGLTSDANFFGNITGHLSLANAATNKEITIQTKYTSGTPSTTIDATSIPLTIDVYYYPSSVQQAVNASNSALNWAGYTSVSTACTTTSTTFADMTCGTPVLSEISNTNFGAVTTAGSSLPGFSANFPRTGTYEVCAQVNTQNATSAEQSLRLVDGTGAIINSGVAALFATGGTISPTSLCGHYKVTAVGTQTIKLQGATSAGTLGIFNGTDTSPAISWQVKEINTPFPAPVLVGGVVSPSAGTMNIVRVQFAGASVSTVCSSSPCVIYAGGEGVTSVTRLGAAAYVVNFAAGTFSGPPVCVCSMGAVFGAGACQPDMSNFSSSLAQVNMAADAGGFVQCIGPK